MKRAVILAAYVAIALADAALGQSYTEPKMVKTVPVTSTAAMTPIGLAPPPKEDRVAPSPDRVVMKWGAGGRVVDHRLTFEEYFKAGTKVELRGPCYSACTLILGYLERANLCIAPGAFMAFHAVRGEKYKQYMPDQTRAMYETWPPEIRRWIERNGGWEKLPIDGFWTMYDHELWTMGYPRCK